MPSKQAIFTDKVLHTIPSVYSQAIVSNGTVYCSGVIGVDPKTGVLIEGNVQDRTVSIQLSHRMISFTTTRGIKAVASSGMDMCIVH